MFKKTISSMLLAIGLFVAMPMVCGMLDSQYAKLGTVVDTNGSKVYVQDVGGNIWTFYGDNFNHNDRIKMVMDNNHTAIINDDRVIKAKKL